MAGEEPERIQWIRKQACALCGGPGPCEPHHAKFVPEHVGKGQKSHDRYAIPLHLKCHRQRHDASGPFRGWDKSTLRTWEETMYGAYQVLYDSLF